MRETWKKISEENFFFFHLIAFFVPLEGIDVDGSHKLLNEGIKNLQQSSEESL